MDQEQSIAVEDMVQVMRRGEKRRKKQQSLEECLEQARRGAGNIKESVINSNQEATCLSTF